MARLLKRLMLIGGLLFGGWLITFVLATTNLPIRQEQLYGTYQHRGQVLVLNRDGTYKYVLRYPDSPCVSCEGRWEYYPEGHTMPMVLLHSYVDRLGREPRDQEKWFERPLIQFGEVVLWVAPEVYAFKVPPEAYVPCGQAPGDK